MLDLALLVDSFNLKNDRLDAIGATRDECVVILHPRAKVPARHQDQKDFVNVIPGPITREILWPFGHIVHDEFLSFGEELAGP